MLTHRAIVVGGIVLAVAFAPLANAETTTQTVPETMGMLRDAVAFQTVQGKGQVPAFAQYLAARLESAGFAKSDIEITPFGETATLAVHYRGSDATLKPILVSGHMDVVAANPADWQRDPFTLVEENGYLYGRGAADMKSGIVTLVATFMRLRREGYTPKREMILVFSGDEEAEMASTHELAKRFRDAEFVLNDDGGGGTLDATGKPILYELQAAEKTEVDFLLTVTSPGGHSSEPNAKENAINRLARALDRIAGYEFPVQHNSITLASLKTLGAQETGPLAAAMTTFAANPDDTRAAAVISADPTYVGQIRTTCIATQLNGGHAHSALPQRATANINCRIFPGTDVATVATTLYKVIGDATVAITVQPPTPAPTPASPLRTDVLDAVTATIHERFPNVAVVPTMSAYATDSLRFRAVGIPSYGVAPEFAKANDTFAHGLNEKLPASEILAALDYWHSLLTKLSR